MSVGRARLVAIRDERDARSAPVGSIAQLDGERYHKAGENTWESDHDVRTDADMLRGRLWVRK